MALWSPADPHLIQLRAWQMERLAQTHAALLASERYGPACRFFLSDLFAPRDFSQRDQGFQHLYQPEPFALNSITRNNETRRDKLPER